MTKQSLKIVFFGTPDFAVESLRRLVDGGYNVAAVVTMPDKQAGRGHHIAFSPVKQFALERNLTLLQPVSLKDPDFINALRNIDAQLFIVIAFRMLPEVVWAMPKLGTFNLHASLLPKYRGAAPINWAIINGETSTGVTTFFLQHEIDTGDIIEQRSIDIAPKDNAGTIHDRLMTLGAEMVVFTVNNIINGTFTTRPQQTLIEAGQEPTPAPKIFRDTCHLKWAEFDAATLHNYIRGLSPYPAAWSILSDGDSQWNIKIFDANVVDKGLPHPAGTVVVEHGRIFVACSGGTLEITSLQTAGKRRMNADEFLRGLRYNGQLKFE